MAQHWILNSRLRSGSVRWSMCRKFPTPGIAYLTHMIHFLVAMMFVRLDMPISGNCRRISNSWSVCAFETTTDICARPETWLRKPSLSVTCSCVQWSKTNVSESLSSSSFSSFQQPPHPFVIWADTHALISESHRCAVGSTCLFRSRFVYR